MDVIETCMLKMSATSLVGGQHHVTGSMKIKEL
jgi:hypothetical protein